MKIALIESISTMFSYRYNNQIHHTSICFKQLTIYDIFFFKNQLLVILSCCNKHAVLFCIVFTSITKTIWLCPISTHNLGHRVTHAAGWTCQSNCVFFSLDVHASFNAFKTVRISIWCSTQFLWKWYKQLNGQNWILRIQGKICCS